MKKTPKLLLLCILLLCAELVYAKLNYLQTWRYSTNENKTRLVFDVSGKPDYVTKILRNPDRLVIDIKRTNLEKPLIMSKAHPLLSGIRSSVSAEKLRVVVDLKRAINSKSFTLIPNKTYPNHRLVIDLQQKQEPKTKPRITKVKSSQKTPERRSAPVKTKVLTQTRQQSRPAKTISSYDFLHRKFIVAIDAGHGGRDPGAEGLHGTQEKKVVLEISKKLKTLVDKTPGMKGVLTRKGDYFVKLRDRMEIARQQKADLFISIHANSFDNRNVQGASVFTVSHRGASSEAAHWLANKENASDLVGGVTLDDKEDILASVLLDLSQTVTKDSSAELADSVLRNFKSIGRLHKRSVQKAGFVVLKSPDIPSILVETAYISNPYEENKLRSRKHQSRMAQAIYKGVVEYYRQHKPENIKTATIEHVITRGETLSGIAALYGVSMRRLENFNRLTDRRVRIGQKLSIPNS